MHPLRWTGRWLARWLSEPRDGTHAGTSGAGRLVRTLSKGDVLLVEGTSRFATAIRTVTQSNWSHSALYVGDALAAGTGDPTPQFIEADINDGVRAVPIGTYTHLHTRICRPVGLSDAEVDALIGYAVARIGGQYDLRNVFDLARYLVHPQLLPARYRRRMLAFGSGDPTRAICSSLIAAAFASIGYPVLPDVELVRAEGEAGREHAREILHIRDSSLYAPRDFDMSPYFRIVKPTIENGFDREALVWAPRQPATPEADGQAANRGVTP